MKRAQTCDHSSQNESADLRDTNDHVVDKALQCVQHGDVLPASLPDCECDAGGLALDQPDVDVGMSEVLGEGTTGALDGDEAGLDGNFNALWDGELFGLEDVPHLERGGMSVIL